LFSLIYIGLGWYVGLNYGRKAVLFGPYPDIPVVMKTQLLGSSLKDISGISAIVMVVPLDKLNSTEGGSIYFKITGYFEVPGTWSFEFKEKTFAMTGSYSRAIAHEAKNPKKRLGSLSVFELRDFLQATGRSKDIEKLKPYLFLAKLEERYPWFYSDTVFLSRAMGNIFKDDMLPYDILGLAGIVVFFIVMAARRFWLWGYCLFWVFAYWFGRIGYHDINLAFSNEGWQVIIWSFWNGFIMKEGRLFLVVALGLSVIVFGILVIVYLVKQAAVFLKRKD
jgi:hypothetical protein